MCPSDVPPGGLVSVSTNVVVFGLFIATPAVALALLGLRAIRAEEIERRQRLGEQEHQTARLADAALASALNVDRIAAESRLGAGATSEDVVVFEVDDRGVVAFPADRVFVGPFGVEPALLPPRRALPPAVAALIDQAQVAEAQGRTQDAIALFEQVGNHADLRPWATLQVAVLRIKLGEPTAAVSDSHLAASDARTAAGIPLAVVASAYGSAVPPRDRARFVPLITQTLTNLRAGRWWLSLEQRRAYDEEVRRWLADCSAAAVLPMDAHLERLAKIEPVIGAAIAAGSGPTHRAEVVKDDQGAVLLVWSPRDQVSHSWRGLSITGSRLAAVFETALRPAQRGQAFAIRLSDQHGGAVWGRLGGALAWKSETLDTLNGWKLEFTGPAPPAAGRRVLSYAFVLLPVVMLGSGLVMTAWIVRREMAFARLQSTFVAAVTHEFKSPITSIRLLMERVSGGRLGPNDSPERYYGAIGAETDRLEGLVNRLLESQKLQSGQKEYARRPSSLPALAQSAVDRLRPQAEAKGIQLDLRVGPGVPDLPLDRESVADAIVNLIDNAIKYSPSQTQVSIIVHTVNGAAQLDVCDQGVGVQRAEAGLIFEPFYRSRHGDREDVHGTGLGLSLVKAAADAHGGSVEVSSDGARGSRFTLRFPIPERT